MHVHTCMYVIIINNNVKKKTFSLQERTPNKSCCTCIVCTALLGVMLFKDFKQSMKIFIKVNKYVRSVRKDAACMIIVMRKTQDLTYPLN